LLTDDDDLALIDLGMIGRVLPGMQDQLLRLLLAISEGRGEEAAEVSMKMGEAKEKFDRQEYKRRVADLVAENSAATLGRINAGQVALEITRIAGDCWFRLPSEYTMIAKAMLNLDRIVLTLDPAFDPNAIIREQASQILQRNLLKTIAPANLMSGMVELKEFAEKLPSRINRILDTFGDNQLRLKVDAIDEKLVMEGLQKVANRITLGLVLAALIVGAAMLTRVETSFRIMGYPGLPLIFFMLAAIAGIGLIVSIVLYDVKARKRD
jgi:predicted unusual protein kinase regulating ubiquinone biosynthesis (AarF/ABC1/UbiB family)